MKRKILSVLLLVFTIALAFSVVSFASESESEIGLNIEGANLSFEDSVYVIYAVSHEGIDADAVQMLFWTSPKASEDDYKIGSESYSGVATDISATLSGSSCKVFKNDKLRAKNMTDYVYARAYAKVGDVEYYSEVSKYSILQYAYNMLGKTAEPSDSAAFKNMLSSMLQYGADAQTYFGHATSRLADADFYQINVVGGTLSDGFAKGLYTAGEAATLTAPATSGGEEFSGWKSSSGEIVSRDNPFILDEFTKNETYTAVYGEAAPDPLTCVHADDNSDGVCDGCESTVNAKLNLLAVNDIHGKIFDAENHIGVDELTTYIKNLRKEYDNFILTSTGDMWQGSYESNLTKGLMMTDWMNEAGFVSMTLGNHEFDWGDKYIYENAELAEFPILAINIYDNETNERASYCQPSIVVECEGFSVGIIGAIGDCYSSISSEKVENVTFKVGSELTALVKAESERLKSEGVDVIVLSVHDGYDNYDASLSNGYVDAVFEGHTHASYVNKDSYGVYHIQGGGDNKGISNIIMSYNIVTDELTVDTARFISTDEYAALEDDPIVDELRVKYAEEVALGERHVATLPSDMDGTTIRNLVAETYLSAGLEKWGNDYDIFLGGGYISVRDPKMFSAGDLYYKDIFGVLTFDNPITLCSVSGANLLSKFVNTTNTNYFIAYSEYGADNADSIDESATYYIIVDTYSAYYKNNGLTVIDTYDENIYARDLVAEYLEGAYPPVIDDETEEETVYFDDMITVGDALEIGAGLALGERTEEQYLIVGKITSITGTTYGNMYIEDELGNAIYIYGLYDESGIRYDSMVPAPAVGDTVIVKSDIYYYSNTNDPTQNKLELYDATLISFAKGKTVAEANDIGESLAVNTATAEKYYMLVTVTEIKNTEYGNLYVTDASGETIYVYGTWDKSNTNRFGAFLDQIKVGDTILLYSAVKHYQNADGTYTTIELENAILLGKIV